MRLSAYFEDLSKAYQAELEDLQSDSEGKNVLAARLNQKRAQFKELMPMIGFAPEMVAPVFHNAVTILNAQALVMLAFAEPEDFPAWQELAPAVQMAPWAEKFVAMALLEPEGERFMLTVICLEFLHAKDVSQSAVNRATGANDDTGGEADGEGEQPDGDDGDDEKDLDEAGADWMSEQGFDRRG